MTMRPRPVRVLPVAGILMAVAATSQVLAGYSGAPSLPQWTCLAIAGVTAGIAGWWAVDSHGQQKKLTTLVLSSELDPVPC